MINETRSMNVDLAEGATDGRYRKLTPDRGGQVETTAHPEDRRTAGDYYGVVYDYGEGPAPDATLRKRLTILDLNGDPVRFAR